MSTEEITIIAAAVLAIVGVIVGWTKTKKDDKVLEVVTEVLDEIRKDKK